MLGEALALGTALTWAVSVILFKRSEEISPQGLNLFKNVIAIILLAATLPLIGQAIDTGRASGDWLRLIASGVLGIAFADTFFFMALRRLGASLLAVVECIYAPSMILLSMLFLGEKPGLGFAAGGVLVVAGVLFATTEQTATQAETDRRERALGITIGVIGVIGLVVGVILVKPVLERSSLVEVTFIRLIAGVTAQIVWTLADGTLVKELEVFRPRPVWRTLMPAAVLGSYVSMLFWLGGFKWADASTASVLNQLTTVAVIILGRIFLQEAVSPRRALGAAAAVGGAIVVFLVRETA